MALGVTGIASEEDVAGANDRIMKELERISSEGFEWDAMQAALHKMEFQFREQSSGSMPRGAQIFSDVLTHWNYDRDPLLPLHAANEFVNLKTEIEENGQDYLMELLTKQIVESKHTTSLDLHP